MHLSHTMEINMILQYFNKKVWYMEKYDALFNNCFKDNEKMSVLNKRTFYSEQIELQ